jgi:D-mannonate dehydratase
VEDKPASEGASPALEIVISGNKALAFENERLRAENSKLHVEVTEARNDRDRIKYDCEAAQSKVSQYFSQIEYLDRKLRSACDTVVEQANTIATLRLQATCHSCRVATGDLRVAKEAAEHYREEWENAKARERDKEMVIERLKAKAAVWPQERPVAYCISMPDQSDTKVHSLSFDKASLQKVVTAHGGKIEPLYRMK